MSSSSLERLAGDLYDTRIKCRVSSFASKLSATKRAARDQDTRAPKQDVGNRHVGLPHQPCARAALHRTRAPVPGTRHRRAGRHHRTSRSADSRRFDRRRIRHPHQGRAPKPLQNRPQWRAPPPRLARSFDRAAHRGPQQRWAADSVAGAGSKPLILTARARPQISAVWTQARRAPEAGHTPCGRELVRWTRGL
jgi:hypothetical protein